MGPGIIAVVEHEFWYFFHWFLVFFLKRKDNGKCDNIFSLQLFVMNS